MSAGELNILYEQGPCLAVVKPAGLPTQAPPGIESMETRIKAFYKAREHKTGNIYLGVPHRLDRPVSGVMVFARHARAARRISEQFEARQVKKLYWACVAGIVLPAEGTWSDHLMKIYGHPQAEVVPPDHPSGRHAVLHYRTLGQTAFGSWLEIELETGRTHQVRVQAASRGHPVLGDAMYGSTVTFGRPQEDERLRPIALHARRLSFRHPMTREVVDLTAPLAADWLALGPPTEFTTSD